MARSPTSAVAQVTSRRIWPPWVSRQLASISHRRWSRLASSGTQTSAFEWDPCSHCRPPTAELAGAVAFYSIIHLRPEDRPQAYREMWRVIRPGGWLLVAFHVSLVEGVPGEIMHADEWWGEQVDLDFYYIDPASVVDGVEAAGFTVMARTDRMPWPGAEHESRRCYLLCRKS